MPSLALVYCDLPAVSLPAESLTVNTFIMSADPLLSNLRLYLIQEAACKLLLQLYWRIDSQRSLLPIKLHGLPDEVSSLAAK